MPWPSTELRAATRADDEALRGFLRRIPSGGAVQLELDRDPSFFEALEVEGEDPVVCMIRRGMLIAVGVMSQRRVYINGEPGVVGYLSSLRIAPEHRNGTVLARGFRFLEEAHRTRPARLFLTTIVEDNRLARRVLESGRGRLPRYASQGRLVTLNYAVDALRGRSAFEVEAGADADELVDFWRDQGPRRQFFPVVEVDQLKSSRGVLRGLRADDVLVARSHGRVVGTLGLWDQRSFRQWSVAGYGRALRWSRHLYNLYARMFTRPRLPSPGTILDYRIAALVCVRQDDPDVLESLLRTARTRLAGRTPLLSMALHEEDPLLATARRFPHRSLRSRLYVAHWPDGREALESLDGRCPHVELGSL